MALDVDRLVRKPDQLQRLAEGVRRQRRELIANACHLLEFGGAAGVVAAVRFGLQEFAVAACPSAKGRSGVCSAAVKNASLSASLSPCRRVCTFCSSPPMPIRNSSP